MMADLNDKKGFLASAKADNKSLRKKIETGMLRLDTNRTLLSRNEALQNFLMEEIAEMEE